MTRIANLWIEFDLMMKAGSLENVTDSLNFNQ